MDKLDKQICPVCNTNNLTLTQDEINIPNFGNTFIFSMCCSNCGYHKADVESLEQKEPSKFTFIIEKEADMKIRVIKSGNATIKIPQLKIEVTPGPSSEGYISNIEGMLERFKKIIEAERDTAEDNEVKKHAKKLLKKLWDVSLGDEELKIIIEDPSGNSAIISDKAVKEKLK